MFVLLFSTLAFGDEAVRVDPDVLPADWILDLVLYLVSIPTVGPALKTAFEWVAALSVITTVLCGAAIVTLKTLSPLLTKLGLDEKAKLIEEKGAKVIYWLKFVSLFNAKAPTKTAGQIVADKK